MITIVLETDVIGPDAFSKWDDGSLIPKEKQDETLQNYKNAMKFQGIGVVAED